MTIVKQVKITTSPLISRAYSSIYSHSLYSTGVKRQPRVPFTGVTMLEKQIYFTKQVIKDALLPIFYLL